MPGGRGHKSPDPGDPLHDQILDMVREGKGRNEISRELNIPYMWVTRTTQRAGLSFLNTTSLVAVEALRRRNAERRAHLATELLDDVEQLRERLFSPLVYVDHGGKDFRRVEVDQDQPVPHDQAALVRSVSMLIDRHV